jgi:hypothetical protein
VLSTLPPRSESHEDLEHELVGLWRYRLDLIQKLGRSAAGLELKSP